MLVEQLWMLPWAKKLSAHPPKHIFKGTFEARAQEQRRPSGPLSQHSPKLGLQQEAKPGHQNKANKQVGSTSILSHWAQVLAPSHLLISAYFRALEVAHTSSGCFSATISGQDTKGRQGGCLGHQILLGVCSSKITRREVNPPRGEMQSQRCQVHRINASTEVSTFFLFNPQSFAAFELFPLLVMKDKEVRTRKEM